MIDAHGRPGLAKISDSVGRFFARLGVTPDQVTIFGMVGFLPAAILAATGHTFAAFWLGLFMLLADLLDGAVAKARGGGTRRGAVLDAVADRVTEAMLLGGLGWLLASQEGASANAMWLLVFVVLSSGYLVSYTRAKAAEAGLDAHVGLFERGERLLLLGFGVLLQTWWNVLPVVLWIVLVGNAITAMQRLWAVWRQGTQEPPLPIGEVRVLPEWKELRTTYESEGDVRSVWVSQRSEWVHRREVARERRLAARAERERIRHVLDAEAKSRRGARQTRRPRRRHVGQRRP